ncbi:MAG: hypothetical protein POH28_16720, partial [Acidocella sp.]|nr:hypothetical protein [Acidocella sp.]
VTTARDLAILARDIVINDRADQNFFEVQKFDFYGHTIYSNNQMLKTFPDATGMKTGYTDLARHNLVTSAERDGHVLIGVVLHEPSWGTAYDQMTAMLDAGFDGHHSEGNINYATNTQPTPPTAPADKHAETLAANNDHVSTPNRVWTAQLGHYRHLSSARYMADHARHIQGAGIARVARIIKYGHVLWTAQLAGLTLHDAYETCDAVATKECRVIGPAENHVAIAKIARPGISGT